MKALFPIFLLVIIASPVYAHPGKTDPRGGHRCLKECAEWGLYYQEYHLHDKDGRPIRVAKKKPPRSRPKAAPVDVLPAPDQLVADPPAAESPAPVAASVISEPEGSFLPWFLIVLLLLLFLVRRRTNRRNAAEGR